MKISSTIEQNIVDSSISYLSINSNNMVNKIYSAISTVMIASTISAAAVSCSVNESGYTNHPPLFVSAEVGRYAHNIVSITFDRLINPYNYPTISDFSVTYSGAVVEQVDLYSYVPIITLILSRSISKDEVGYISYIITSSPLLDNETGDPSVSFTNKEIINNIQ